MQNKSIIKIDMFSISLFNILKKLYSKSTKNNEKWKIDHVCYDNKIYFKNINMMVKSQKMRRAQFPVT